MAKKNTIIFQFFERLPENLQDELHKNTVKFYCKTCEEHGRKDKSSGEKLIFRCTDSTTSNLHKHLSSETLIGHSEALKKLKQLINSDTNSTPKGKKRKLDDSVCPNSPNLLTMGSVTVKQKYKFNDYNQQAQLVLKIKFRFILLY